VLELATQSFGKWLQLSLGVSPTDIQSCVLLSWDLQCKKQSEDTLFYPNDFLGHRNIISPPICENLCSHALPLKVVQVGKRISGANTKN
jgi:hypothetical protein